MCTWPQFIDFIRTLKSREREQAAFAFAALCFSAGYAVVGKLLVDTQDGIHWQGWLQFALYAVGAVSLTYAAVHIWRLAQLPEVPPTKDRPSAIKGPMAFTEADGELFRKLGRESELQKLLGLVLDDQALMIVVRGASGSGKTSLLRAGLKHILGDRAIFHYWEAVPTEPDKGLLRAIQEKWPEGATKPATLDELVNPADALGRQSHVIVLDQFEQLRGSRKIFALLRRIVRESRPPHRITWVIAFRREFSADWMDFVSPELAHGFRPPQDISLRLFTAEQAREVIGQLVNDSNLKDSIEQAVINNLVEAATVESEVSPVDIGIGLLVLAELHERQSGQTVRIRDYQFAGGAEGLLTQYISRCLDSFPRESQEAILKAMLALRDAETNQRLAEGLTVEELAREAKTEARLLKPQLDRLSHRDTRLLEAIPSVDDSPVRYRLPHERLIPALYRLTGKLLAEVDQAKLKFLNAFQAWKTNDKRSAYLLKAKELRLVERYETQIPWGNDEQEKKSYLDRSKRHRAFARAGLTAALVAFIAVGSTAGVLYQRYEHKKYLYDFSYPRELYDWQGQLEKLELTQALDLERFSWLCSDSLKELSLQATISSTSMAGLASLSKCRNLEQLTLDLHSTQVRDLKPLEHLTGLQQLTLNLGEASSQVSDLGPLEHLTKLQQLTLDFPFTQVSDLKPLEHLTGLQQLTLNLGEDFGRSSPVSDLKSLEHLTGLQRLALDLRSTPVSDLKSLEHLTGLQQLTLDLRLGQVSDLKPLEHLTGLQQLTLTLGDDVYNSERFSPVSDLKPLEHLTGLQQLTLSLGGDSGRSSQVRDLEPLEHLIGLQQLALDLRFSQVSDLKPLEHLSGLQQLTLTLGDEHGNSSKVSDLKPLEHLTGLQQLTLNLGNDTGGLVHVRDLEPLGYLTGLQRLTLHLGYGPGGVSQLSDLKLLAHLARLQQLTLDFGDSGRVISLKPLEQLTGLQQLSLNPGLTLPGDLKPLEQLTGLRQLTLKIRFGDGNDLDPLEHLTGLQQLTLDLRYSQVSDLKPLEHLTGLQQLTLDLSSSQVSDLMPLEHLTGLQQLTLKLRDDFGRSSPVSDLRPLGHLKELKFLAFSFSGTNKEKNLDALGQLPKLRALSITDATTEQRRSLRTIPKSDVELKF